jgi:hypothetical protein
MNCTGKHQRGPHQAMQVSNGDDVSFAPQRRQLRRCSCILPCPSGQTTPGQRNAARHFAFTTAFDMALIKGRVAIC